MHPPPADGWGWSTMSRDIRSPMSRDTTGCPRQDSNLRTRLRRPVLYPLSYEGWMDAQPRGANGARGMVAARGSAAVCDHRAMASLLDRVAQRLQPAFDAL